MKKLLLACITLTAAVTAFGQGQVSFANNGSTLFTTNVGAVSGTMRGAGLYAVGLYTAAPGTVNEALFTLVATATNGIFAGQFSYPEAPYTFTANNGTPIAVQVRAWTLARGNTYELAIGGLRGQTPIGTVTPAINGATPPSLFDNPGGVFTSGIVLQGVPEPSSIALGLLGLGAIALFRRRK